MGFFPFWRRLRFSTRFQEVRQALVFSNGSIRNGRPLGGEGTELQLLAGRSSYWRFMCGPPSVIPKRCDIHNKISAIDDLLNRIDFERFRVPLSRHDFASMVSYSMVACWSLQKQMNPSRR